MITKIKSFVYAWRTRNLGGAEVERRREDLSDGWTLVVKDNRGEVTLYVIDPDGKQAYFLARPKTFTHLVLTRFVRESLPTK